MDYLQLKPTLFKQEQPQQKRRKSISNEELDA